MEFLGMAIIDFLAMDFSKTKQQLQSQAKTS